MSDSPSSPRLRLAVTVAIVLVHLALVPIAIAVTLLAYGFEDAFTIRNQTTWTPIVTAQCSLLVLVLGFGAGNAYLRGTLFFLGIAYVIMSVVWAYSMLWHFPEPLVSTWMAHMKVTSIWLLMPSFVAGIALMPLRALVGTVQLESGDTHNQFRFRIADLLAITFLLAAILGWYHFVMNDQLREAITMRSLARSTGFNTVCAVGCLVIVLSPKWSWFGGIISVAMMVSLRIYYPHVANAGFMSGASVEYLWGVVAGTLVAFRLLGYRLQRNIPEQIPFTTGIA